MLSCLFLQSGASVVPARINNLGEDRLLCLSLCVCVCLLPFAGAYPVGFASQFHLFMFPHPGLHDNNRLPCVFQCGRSQGDCTSLFSSGPFPFFLFPPTLFLLQFFLLRKQTCLSKPKCWLLAACAVRYTTRTTGRTLHCSAD